MDVFVFVVVVIVVDGWMLLLFRSFNFDAWRKRFNGWVDQQKLRVNDLFRRFDSNHDGMLTREEFMKGLKASGNVCVCVSCLLWLV